MKLPQKTRIVVIDSNVWISALVFGGNPRKAFENCVAQGEIIVLSAEMITETRRIVRKKFPQFISDYELLLAALSRQLSIVPLGKHTVTVSRDPDDNTVLETALIAGAQYIISGDKDLLVLKKYQTIDIITPADFLRI